MTTHAKNRRIVKQGLAQIAAYERGEKSLTTWQVDVEIPEAVIKSASARLQISREEVLARPEVITDELKRTIKTL